MPPNGLPSSSPTTWPPRDKRTTNTVPPFVTATHNQARCRPWRQPVSSTDTLACFWIAARASATAAWGLRGLRFPRAAGPQTAPHPKEVLPQRLRGALGEAIGPRTPRHEGLHPRPIRPPWDPLGPRRARGGAAGRTHHLMHLILDPHRLAGRNFDNLMPLGLRVLACKRLLTMAALFGLERNHHVHVFYGHQPPGLPRVTGLSPATPSTGLATWSLGRGRIPRGRPRRGARVLLHALPQLLHGSLQRRDTCFKCQSPGFRAGCGPKVQKV